MGFKPSLAVFVSLLLVFAPSTSAMDPKTAGRLSAEGPAAINGVPAPTGTTVYPGDRITAGEKGTATVTLAGGSRIVVAPGSSAQLRKTGDRWAVTIETGTVGFVLLPGEPLVVAARGVLVHPAAKGPSRYVARVESKAVLLTGVSGDIRVEGRNVSYTVPAGKSMRFELGEAPQGPVGAGAANFATSTAWILAAVVVVVGLAIALPIALNNNKVSP